eukprot:c14081_g1_i1 orf=2-166(-)
MLVRLISAMQTVKCFPPSFQNLRNHSSSYSLATLPDSKSHLCFTCNRGNHFYHHL